MSNDYEEDEDMVSTAERHEQIMDEGDARYTTIKHILIVIAISLVFSCLLFGAELLRHGMR